MSVYPFALDSDETIIRIDDNISELGTEAINQLRDAVFNMQGEMGLGLSGSMGTLASRLDVSINANGTIKASALTSVGLATLPIVDNQVASNAGIKEYKLSLDHTTSDLYTLISSNAALLASLVTFANTTAADLSAHISGATLLSDGSTSARHVASHIDLNQVTSDSRDPFFTWAGLKDKTGAARSATTVAGALDQINTDLTSHENATANAHLASAVDVVTDDFQEIPPTADTVQKVIDYLDDSEVLNIGQHRAVQHAAGIPKIARSISLVNDGYGDQVVPPTSVVTYLANPPSINPIDSNTVGDDVVKFVPTNPTSDFLFDSQFSQVRVGDIITINYGNGTEASYPIESIRYTPGSDWYVRINGYNLCDGYDGYARIDRSLADSNTSGVLAVASANSIPNTLYPTLFGSLIIGHPRGAAALGLEFDPNQLDSTHYNLYLQLYPTGNPEDKIIDLPAIDVTGNAGVTPGKYTLNSVVNATNDAFRAVGYNYRFIAFDHFGDFGLMVADAIGKASFAIINGDNSSGTLSEGTFTNNVVDDISAPPQDALGMGKLKAVLASPSYLAAFSDSLAAQTPTKVITPRKFRNYIANGQRKDEFALTYLATDGYWPATIHGRTSTGSSIEVTYRINLDLGPAELKPGKTIVVQPTIDFEDTLYVDVDYGRFIIKEVVYTAPCGSEGAITDITVISGVHATGNPLSFTSDVGLEVKLYFSEDSVSFNDTNMIDNGLSGSNFHRLHEVYVDSHGKTFTHERARVLVQNEQSSPPKLRTDYWHVPNVSPKLRGYRDDLTTFNKYVRFYVLSYDTDTGEYDGYIGQRDPASNAILLPGPVATGRKNVPTKFYDETNVDFIELLFDEIVASPGTDILSDGASGGGGTPRYVDIELFASLQSDDEFLLLATAEVNWDPPTGQNIIQNVTNRRAFGSIGEDDFTKNALDFIRAGERLLHQNGVIRGYEFVSVLSTDNRQLSFNGGVAVVNGTIVSSNNQTVFIPQISESGTTPDTVFWAVCVNESGYLTPILITPTGKTQFFAEAALYYLPSVTFDELVNTRKDLTAIAMVEVAIASITIDDEDVSDVRKIVLNETKNISLMISNNKFEGNFASWVAAKNWINLAGDVLGNTIKVRGTWDIDETIDFSDLVNPLVLEGDGATINVTAAQGFKLGSNLTIRNINFSYAPPSSLVYTSGDRVNSGNGCLFAGETVQFVTIERCTFEQLSSSYTQRPPFIGFELENGENLTSIRIFDNTFTDHSNTGTMAGVAIIGLNSGVSSTPAFSRDVFIERNAGNISQGIFVACADGARPGLRSFNTVIAENAAGMIGYFVASTNVSGAVLQHSLVITRNRCKVIASVDSAGQVMYNTGNTISVATSNVLIQGNACHWIHVMAQDNAANVEFGSVKIMDNMLSSNSASSFLSPYNDTSASAILVGLPGIVSNAAIAVHTDYAGLELGSNTICGNTCDFGKFSGSLYPYDIGIYIASSGIVSNNVIRALNTNAYGIYVDQGLGPGSGARIHTITHNHVFRATTAITAYIYINAVSPDSNDRGIVTENIFDALTVDNATNFDTILPLIGDPLYPVRYTIDRNKNYVAEMRLHPRAGNWAIDNIIAGDPNTTSQIVQSYTDASGVNYLYNNTTNDERASWRIPLQSILPYGSMLTKVVVNANLDATTGLSTKTLSIDIVTTDGSSSGSSTLTAVAANYTLIATSVHIVRADIVQPDLLITIRLDGTNTRTAFINAVTLTWRWP